ncbi:MAG: methylmalonyl Co-A mutase-associated GTPase MeaB [Pseudomonadota bacterium]
MASFVPSGELVERVCAGEINAIARLLTRAEQGSEECRPALDEIYRRAGRAHVVGITGVPGSGKSTLVAALAKTIRQSGRRVAIIAIDPSSPFTGGSILGDRIRMNDLTGDPGVFVRSMATRGALGGLARGTLEAVDILDAAGFEVVIIETVGIGQGEVDIVRASHTTVVVSAPGLGDDIQAIKAGVLEIADIHVVSKCDRPDANKTIIDLKAMLGIGLALSHNQGWAVPVLATSAPRGEGVAELLDAMLRHRAALEANGGIGARRRLIAERRVLKAAEALIADRFERHRGGRVADLLGGVTGRRMSPHAAAVELLNEIRMED